MPFDWNQNANLNGQLSSGAEIKWLRIFIQSYPLIWKYLVIYACAQSLHSMQLWKICRNIERENVHETNRKNIQLFPTHFKWGMKLCHPSYCTCFSIAGSSIVFVQILHIWKMYAHERAMHCLFFFVWFVKLTSNTSEQFIHSFICRFFSCIKRHENKMLKWIGFIYWGKMFCSHFMNVC